MSDLKFYIILYVILSGAALAILFGTMWAVMSRRRKSPPASGTSEVGFVVNTFNELVTKLKLKEKELEELRSKAEERAGNVEEYNENILQSVPSGVISLDEGWRIVKANESARRVLGMEARGLGGMDFKELFPDERMHVQGKRGETQYLTPTGKRIWLGYSLTPLLDAAKNTIGKLFVFTDLTELKALEGQAELRKRLSSLGEMSAGIAHELKNSMGVISGYMRLLSMKAGSELSETVEAVSSEVKAMDRIISDFLLFSRPRSLNFSEVGLRGLVEGAANSVTSSKEGIKVAMDVPEDLSVEADEVILRQAFANLIQNASESMGVAGTVAVEAQASGDEVLISVSDTGHGIDEGIRQKILLPFFTTKEKGTGLGLAIVHRTIVDHGGSLDIESGETGTTVRIKLPLRQVS